MDLLAALSAEVEWSLVVARAAADMTILVQFGAVLASAWLLRPPPGQRGASLLARFALWSVAAAWLCNAAWLGLQGAAIAGSVAETPAVIAETTFGHVMALRLCLLLMGAAALAARLRRVAVVPAGAAVAVGAGLGHAWALSEGPSWLLLSVAVHLLAAGAWLGGLPALLALLADAPPGTAAACLRRFAGLGAVCVAALAATAAFQSAALIGTWAGLLGSDYGLVALAKLGLFVILLAFAAVHRFRLTPALDGRNPLAAKRRLARSIAGETVVGLLIVLAAGLLSSLAPAMKSGPG